MAKATEFIVGTGFLLNGHQKSKASDWPSREELEQQLKTTTAEVAELRKIATLAASISSRYHPRCAEDAELRNLLTAWREKEQTR